MSDKSEFSHMCRTFSGKPGELPDDCDVAMPENREPAGPWRVIGLVGYSGTKGALNTEHESHPKGWFTYDPVTQFGWIQDLRPIAVVDADDGKL